ncbi:MAG: tRNA pseudouridine(38-40) synthase TruA [Steroidobacteraceae bacterium]
MHRVAAGIEYDGALFRGWQSQESARTVQAEVERALSRVAGEAIHVVAAGRTDAGVHAAGQVAHFDAAAVRTPRAWLLGANTYLPRDVSLTWVSAVAGDFHARYSAEARSYRYLILNRGARSALAATRAAWIHQPLDHERMAVAVAPLLGEHDFSAFRSSDCQSRSPLRRIERFVVTRAADRIVLEVTANAFLHHMVRNLAGLLIAIGRGDLEPADVSSLLAGGDRTRLPATAPPQGLYLASVRYAARFGLPAPPIPASGDPL